MTTASIRRGFTLVELLLSLIVTAIVGTALIKMVMSQARFMDQQEAWRGARSVARGGINRLLSDLRAVEAFNGVTAAAAGGQDFTIRVPYAFGVLCRTNGNNQTLALLPVDSAMFAAAGYSGFAWRNNANGSYTIVPSGVAPVPQANGNDCLAAGPLPILGNSAGVIPSINGAPTGRVVIVNGAIPAGTQMGTIFYLYRNIRYEFKASNIVPGGIGLFRTAGGVEEEIASPFANTARVNFYVLNTAAPQAAVPGTLNQIRGLELVLDGMSERAPQGTAAPKTANVRTSVFFENRPD